ncbi:DUF560 domain containing protein [Sulfitobacter noctilucicola]|uniref:Surface lipoprotein assembly modifier C-terminal domain-containing protein n=1 Tax=Sulfitobacter noctilucicola TaxID=1342301 RepID=A0A7W6MAG6_9RHOB|nr:surface lipoprotein assembly modifier [Sulfitobacter noctilucicola]KIN64400.1 DUF560 domain containing protein [Sulfitobacter noctilucicola]MBB4174441.1 hypothetical protein [Sulfitobacter noctilucicola]
MASGLARCIAAAAACLLVGLPTLSAQETLTPDALRQNAVGALQAGDPITARRYAQALILRDPDDLNAHLILARAARDLGDIPPARSAAQTAWSLAQTDAERYSAALITAQVLSTEGKRTRAQFWLRRAAQHAPNDLLREKAKQDFRYVKQQNQWKTDLTFTLAPNSNINNGSAQDRSRLNYAVSEILFGEPIEYELNAEAQAIAGLEIGGTLRTRYRFHQTPVSAHDAKLALSYRTFSLHDDLPGLSGSDFAYGTLAAGYGYRRLNIDGRGEFASDIETGQSWYGGARYAQYLRAQAQQLFRPSRTQQLRFGGELERLWGQATPDRDLIGLSASITQSLPTGNSAYLGLSASTSQSDSASSDYAEIELRTGFTLAKPVLGASVQFGLGASWRDYDASVHSRDGRQDNRLFADVTAVFKQIDYYGFNPSLTLSASRTNSNIGLFDTNRVGLNIGIKSAF